MKTLIIMRHAKSSWSNAHLSDHERPLNSRGKQNAPQMGAHLKQEELTPQLIISSTAKRAASTAKLVAEASDYEGEIIYESEFYHAAPETYIEAVQQLSDEIDRVMVVGHNPGMEALVEELTGEEERFSTANVAVVQIPVLKWQEVDLAGDATLLHLWRPREL